MRFDVLTLFPEIFSGYLSQSLLHKAIQKQFVEVQLHNIRQFAKNKHQSVDDRPFGGGPGMVLKVEPTVECVESVQQMPDSQPGHVVLLTPQGRRFNQQVAEELSAHQRILLLCGRYEGFDQRVVDILKPDEISVGDYILNGGEVAAMILIDSLIRLVPGVLGDQTSFIFDSFSSGNRHLEYHQYTRPQEYRGYEVPPVLISGDHQAIADWREAQSLQKTKQRRSDLLDSDLFDQD